MTHTLRAAILDQTPLVDADDPLVPYTRLCTPLLEPAASAVLESGFLATEIEQISPLLPFAHDLAERLSKPVFREALTSIAVTGALNATWVHPSMLASIVRTAASVAGLLAPMTLKLPTLAIEAAHHQTHAEEPAVTAVTDLASWLDNTEEEVAELAGFSRRNLSNWRAGKSPYPKTVRTLYEIHGIIGALVRHIGKRGTLAWLGQLTEGIPRRSLLVTSEGREVLQKEAQPLIFQKAPSRTFEPERDQLEASPTFRSAPTEHDSFTRPPARRRMPPA